MTNVLAQPRFSNAQLELLRLFREAEKTAKERGYDEEMLNKIVRGDV